MKIKYDRDIWRFTERVTDGDDVYEPGYYYVDFAMQLTGPYQTLDEVRNMKAADDAVLDRSKS